MTLAEAFVKIKILDGVNKFTPKQVYSAIADLGVFKDNPRLQIIAKVALQNGLWDIVKTETVKFSDIETLRNKLDFYGFSDNYVQRLFGECGFGNKIEVTSKDCEQLSPSSAAGRQKLDWPKPTSSVNPLTESSSDIVVEDYLNSVLEINYESFQKYGLTLQQIAKIKWEKNVSKYPHYYGALISYEVTGNSTFSGAICLHLYDTNGYIRSVDLINQMAIRNQYSIINESKLVALCLQPYEISKIVLCVDSGDFTDKRNAFYKEVGPIVKYNGLVINEVDWLKINDNQILYAPSRSTNNISFFIHGSMIKRPSGYGIKSIYAIVFDREGRIRQKFQVVNTWDAHSHNNGIGSSFYWFSYVGSATKLVGGIILKVDCNQDVLRMPFNEIGKIAFIEE